MHQTVKCGSEGSVGDLARIARFLSDNDFDIRAVGGAEGNLRGGDVGVITLLVEPDDAAGLEQLAVALKALDLDGNGRTLTQVEIHPGFDLEIDDQKGSLADAAERLGADNGPADPPINIMSALLVDVHDDWAVVSFAFADDETRARAAARYDGDNRFRVMGEHGGRRRRAKVDREVKGKVKKGED